MALLAEIQATCSSLGYLENDVYIKEPDCLECVKDLIRYLRREDDTCDMRRVLGEAQIVQNDLIPLVKSSLNDSILLDTTIRLLVNLTQPALICFQGYIPTEKTQHNYYLEVLGHLEVYKQAFADQSLFQGLCQKLGDLLQLDWENRQEEDRLLIERILILIRNVLHIAPLEDERRTDDDASIHDQVLWAIHTSGITDLLLYIANSNNERQFSMHILEIVSLFFREQSADQLARAGAGRSMTEKEKDEQELLQSRLREKVEKRLANAKYSTRHSRFGGTYVLANVKSITDNALIYHRSQGDVKNISFDQGKRPKKLGKNRKPILEDSVCRRSTLSIRLALKHFCIQFIENCYNPLMNCVNDRLNHSQAEENDETYYIWAMRFFMEFQRHYKFRMDVISETLSVSTFHYVHVQIMKYNDMMVTNKNEAKTWAKRMHLALKAYKELLLTVCAMDKCSEAIRDSAKVLKSNIVYLPEYKDLLLLLLTKFNQSRQSRSFLKDLVETTHVFLKMLEQYCTGSNHVMVRSKKRKKAKKKKQRPQTQDNENPEEQTDLEGKWDNISSDLSALIQGREELPEIVSPFDAASDVDIEEQKDGAMYKIHDALREERPGEALALLRAARQVWPDQEIFGTSEMNVEAEFMAMRQIFFTNLNRREETSQTIDEEREEEVVSDEEEEERETRMTSEQQFEFKDYLMKFIRPEILKPYVLLLSEYNRNSPQMNHYLVKMLHRIAIDCKVPGMLFQLSLFRVFQKLIQDPVAKVSHKELVKFAHFVIVKFFDMDNKDAFHEILFWKNVRESLEVVDGFGTYQAEKAKSSSWTEFEEMELQRLYEELKERQDSDYDVVDLIMNEIINQNRTRRQIIAKMAHMDLIDSAKDLKNKKLNRVKVWMEEDESQLQGLFLEHKDSPDVLTQILSNLHIKRSKNAVIEKLLGMGLISDRKEVYKRRGKKKKGEEDSERPPKSKEFISTDDDDSDNDNPEKVIDNESETESRKPTSTKKGRRGRRDESSDDDDDDTFLNFISKNKKPTTPKPPKGNLDTHVKKIVAEGLRDDLEWIFSTFKDEAADREEEKADDATPIVPLTASNSAALHNASFEAVLKLLGARPPADEQELYWRIPEYFTPAMLEGRVQNLQTVMDNANVEAEELPDENSDKENRTPKPKARLNKRQLSESSSEDDDPGKLVLDESMESSPAKSPPNKRVRYDSGRKTGNKRQTSQLLLSSDDESDMPVTPTSGKSSQNELNASLEPVQRSQDSVDGHESLTASPQMNGLAEERENNDGESSDSNSDVEDRIPLRKVVRRPMIDSDSD